MNPNLVTPLLALALCTPLAAQRFAITDAGASSFRWGPAPTPGAPSDVGLRASPCAISDNVWAWHWCYSVRGTGVGRTLDDSGHGGYSQTVASPTATQLITDVDRLGRFDARVVDSIVSTGPHSGYAVHDLELTNRGPAPLTLNVYLFADFDYNGLTFNYTLPNSGPDRFVVAGTMSCGGCIELWGDDPDRFMVSRFSDSSGCNDAIAIGADLTNAGMPFGSPANPEDFTGAFQWIVTIAPGAARTLRGATGHNDLFVDAPGSATSSGFPAVGGASGVPTLSAPRPVLGVDLPITVSGAGPATSATLLFGGAAGQPLTLPGCGGLNLGLALVLASVPMSLQNGAGVLLIPAARCADLEVVGVPFSWQAFALDQTSTACLPLIHTDVLTTVFGD